MSQGGSNFGETSPQCTASHHERLIFFRQNAEPTKLNEMGSQSVAEQLVLEIACFDEDSAIIAEGAGADRIEQVPYKTSHFPANFPSDYAGTTLQEDFHLTARCFGV